MARVLPSAARRAVGPFVFFDHMGPAELPAGRGIDVRPHPHIGLATVTYLFEGEIEHRDSLGSDQAIRPGAINWMTAGRGIVHSERSTPEARAEASRLHGIQLWLGLPQADEEVEPAFAHHPSEALPGRAEGGVRLTVLAGTAFGLRSPVRTFSPLMYVDVELAAERELEVSAEHPERAVYVVEGAVRCGAERVGASTMAVLASGGPVTLQAEAATRLVLIGGAPLDGERHLRWNFVSSSPARLEQAARDWEERRFPLVPGDEEEFIPLPK